MQTKIFRGVFGIVLMLGTACSVPAQPETATSGQTPHQRVWRIRSTGVRSNRSKMPLLLDAILKEQL